jgi:hypothetical protein
VAQEAGQDWRPEAARLRKLTADNRLRARFMFRADCPAVERPFPLPPHWAI